MKRFVVILLMAALSLLLVVGQTYASGELDSSSKEVKETIVKCMKILQKEFPGSKFTASITKDGAIIWS